MTHTKPKLSMSEYFNRMLIYLVLCIAAFFVLYPIVYVVAAAFTPGNTLSSANIVPFSGGFTMDHFTYLFERTNYPLWFFNSFKIATMTSIATVLVSSSAAYVFSRYRFSLKRSIMITLLILQIFPSFISMIAIYMVLMRIGGLDTLWGLALVYVAGNIPYNTWLVKCYLDTISPSLDEAARLDGASDLRIFWRIVLPLARPIISFLAITSFCGPWMDFIFPKLVLRSAGNQTIAVGLHSLVSGRANRFTTFSAGALLVVIPFIIFFLCTQRMMVTSLGSAGVKE